MTRRNVKSCENEFQREKIRFKDTVRVLIFWKNSLLFLKWSQNQIDAPKWISLFIFIKYWVWTFTFKTSRWWVIPMTSSIPDSKRVSKSTVRSIFRSWLIFSFFEHVRSLTLGLKPISVWIRIFPKTNGRSGNCPYD